MNSNVRWYPCRETKNLQHGMYHLLGKPIIRICTEEQEGTPRWIPSADIAEDDQGYLLRMDLPGVERSGLKVVVENGVLSVGGERPDDSEADRPRYHRMERARGQFARNFALPEDADAAGITAHYKDGLLTVRLPKSEKAKPRSIEVQAA
jgi:HSP20 family protein